MLFQDKEPPIKGLGPHSSPLAKLMRQLDGSGPIVAAFKRETPAPEALGLQIAGNTGIGGRPCLTSGRKYISGADKRGDSLVGAAIRHAAEKGNSLPRGSNPHQKKSMVEYLIYKNYNVVDVDSTMTTKFISRSEDFLFMAARESHRFAELRHHFDEPGDEPSQRKWTPGQSPGPRPPWIRRLSGVGKGAER